MKTLLSICLMTLFFAACSTVDSASDTTTDYRDTASTGININEFGDTVIQETDGHKITVTEDDGDTTITPLPDIDTDTTP